MNTTPPMSTHTREVVLSIFNRHRAMPGAPFDESHFTDYLLANPKGENPIHNSFRGLRRYNRFIKEVQLHFGICFSLKDFESTYSLQKFLDRIEDLKRSPRGSMASFRNQEKAGFGWGVVFVGNGIGLAVLVPAFAVSLVLGSVFAAFLLTANAAVLWFHFRWRTYQQRLLALLQKKAADTK